MVGSITVIAVLIWHTKLDACVNASNSSSIFNISDSEEEKHVLPNVM